jgi:hypothetical protein
LFGGQYNIVQQGFTYAEYAHHGFAELIMVALISLLLILSAERYVDRKDESHMAPFKATALLLVLGVIAIMASAFKRLNIYQDAYGFTIMRFYVSAFIIWISALFVIFGYKIFKSKRDQFFSMSIFLAVIVFVAIMNIINPEAIIVRQNIKHFDRTGKLDPIYLDRMSEDAVPAQLSVFNRIKDGEAKQGIGYSLYIRQQDLQQSKRAWQEASFSRAYARSLLNKQAAVLENYKNSESSLYPSHPAE